jgi:hypothetical protein
MTVCAAQLTRAGEIVSDARELGFRVSEVIAAYEELI